MSETNKKGEVGELEVQLAAVKKGYYVACMPQDCPYDMVIDRGSGPERVQVKYCTLIDSCKTRRRTYTVDNVDAFVIYVPGHGIFWLPAQEVCGQIKTISLRLLEASNKNVKNIRFASDYQLW